MKTPSLPAIPKNLSPEERDEFLTRQGLAYNVKYRTAACYLQANTHPAINSQISLESFATYLETLLEEAGNPTDPIERMLVEQLAIAHHNIGRLYMKAAASESLEQAEVYNAAASRDC